MIALDTNILVHAHFPAMPLHVTARQRLTSLAEGSQRWAIPVFCLGEFLRVSTHRRIFTQPFTANQAAAALERLLAAPALVVISPGELYPSLLLEALRQSQATGNLVFDAMIVAVCREAGVSTLVTEDRDFGRFPGFSTTALGAS